MPLNGCRAFCAGVNYLHDHGIVHRDLKPGNVFRDDGQIKLGDYGLSKFISCSRRSGQTESIGTVHYMAPEVANGRYGKEIDIYALGIVLYEMLTGHVPFEGESVGEILMKHLTAEPTLEGVPDAYRPMIARALAKDPMARFASVSEMFSALPPLAMTMAYRPPIGETKYAASPGTEPVGAKVGADGPAKPLAYGQPNVQHAPQVAPLAAINAVVVDEDEPVWKAVRDGWRNARASWDGLNTPTKIIVAVIGCSALAYNAELMLALVVPTVALYVLYRVIRSVVLQQETKHRAHHAAARAGGPPQPGAAPVQPRPMAPPQPAAAPGVPAGTTYQPNSYQKATPANVPPGDWRQASQHHWKKKNVRRWREQAAQALVVKGVRERLADLAASMLLAALVGTVMSVVAVLLRGEAQIEREQFVWLTFTSVIGSWAVLIPSKFWKAPPAIRLCDE